MSNTTNNGLTKTKHHYDVLQSVLSLDQRPIPNSDVFEYQAILDDLETVSQMNNESQERSNDWFVLKQNGEIQPHPQLESKDGCVFRSESIGIVYSDIVAIGKNCILLEVSNEKEKTKLKVEPGAKNTSPVDISLYKGEGLLENLQLQKQMSWDLDNFTPGDYKLFLGKKKSFQFVIQG